ncbi:3'-5' exonuclease [Paenibacillus sp. 481]|uniref:3'-5' exonuclease n=1 Tax=Paenibacillus sp. 481 TaxID=2835869 RepID=UPI001E44258C|nr:exonuclease domain-containing protein [Paenibacillus sp. 481]UHA73272.1 3'-5' exonuclease [Paenibacillus sp. 481]
MKEGKLYMEITLALELFQMERRFSTAIFCKIKGIKQGYIYINHGASKPEKAFGEGLILILQKLKAVYHDYSILLAFSEGYLSITYPSIRTEIFWILGQFRTFTFVKERYTETLNIVNQMGQIDTIREGHLHGYTFEQVKNKTDCLTQKTKVLKKQSRLLDYNELFLPTHGVIIDFETNSPYVKFARIFEVGAVKFENGVIVDRFQSFTNPGIKIPPSISELTGIKQSDIDSAPKNYVVMKQLVKFIGNTPVLVGHNLHTFDFELLRKFMDKFHFPPFLGTLLCTRKLSKKIQIISKDYKLETLCELFDIKNKSAHRALSDCEATFELLIALYNHTLLGGKVT